MKKFFVIILAVALLATMATTPAFARGGGNFWAGAAIGTAIGIGTVLLAPRAYYTAPPVYVAPPVYDPYSQAYQQEAIRIQQQRQWEWENNQRQRAVDDARRDYGYGR
jgi:hypothetical protein